MNNKLLLKLVRIWWVGCKVACRWGAFYMVLTILFLPVVGLTVLVGDYAGGILSVALAVVIVLIVPIVFYLTSKYLILLGDDDRDVAQGEENQPPSGTGSNAQMIGRIMKKSTLIIMLVAAPYAFLVMAAILTPSPDVISQIALAIPMMVVCGILAFVISRFKSFGQTPESIKRLIVVLVCLLSITTAYSFTSFVSVIYRQRDSSESSESSFEGGGFSFGNLQVEYSLSDEGVTIVCLVDIPQMFLSGDQGDSRKYTFADGKSVEFVIKNEQTVWIDKQHRVTFLGPVLNK